jgi:hypothetical protein
MLVYPRIYVYQTYPKFLWRLYGCLAPVLSKSLQFLKARKVPNIRKSEINYIIGSEFIRMKLWEMGPWLGKALIYGRRSRASAILESLCMACFLYLDWGDLGDFWANISKCNTQTYNHVSMTEVKPGLDGRFDHIGFASEISNTLWARRK